MTCPSPVPTPFTVYIAGVGWLGKVRIRIREPVNPDVKIERAKVPLQIPVCQPGPGIQDLNTLKIINAEGGMQATLRAVTALKSQIPPKKIYSVAVLKTERDTILAELMPYAKAKVNPLPQDVAQLKLRYKLLLAEIKSREARPAAGTRTYYVGLASKIAEFTAKLPQLSGKNAAQCQQMLQIMVEELEPQQVKLAVKVPVIEQPVAAASATKQPSSTPVVAAADLDFGPKNPLLPLATVLAPANIRSMDVLDYEKTRCGKLKPPPPP